MPKRNPFHRPAFPDAQHVDPDWAHAHAVHSPASPAPASLLGDGTRWGSNEAITLRTGDPTPSGQGIWVNTQDPYSRNWQIAGTVRAPSLAWVLPAADFTIGLKVTMGVGQATQVVVFDIRALIDLADPWYQPYSENLQEIKAFVIAGGIIGRAINAQMIFQVPGLTPPSNLAVACIMGISPYAAGSGI